MLRGTDAWPVFEKLLRGKPGAQPGDKRNPDGINQWINRDVVTVNPEGRPSEPPERINRDVVTVDGGPPETLPIGVPEGPSRKRDYKREARTGNSTSYTLRQLERGKKAKDGTVHPPRPDLLEKVKAGEMAPWKAILEAGYRKATPNLPKRPERA